jgi:hypothetical protein
VREFARRIGLLEVIGEENIFLTVDMAVHFFEASNQEQVEPLTE